MTSDDLPGDCFASEGLISRDLAKVRNVYPPTLDRHGRSLLVGGSVSHEAFIEGLLLGKREESVGRSTGPSSSTSDKA
ncbi:hypothetical protein MJO29_003766 [Puccinia striiformis f. sp. tritici]|nr:hypothetical protein MJO29_003766 [Puccinia striiformis f. sp. tritici]